MNDRLNDAEKDVESAISRLDTLEATVLELNKKLADISDRPGTSADKTPSAEEIARVLSQKYADVLRGPGGQEGATGKTGQKGAEGQIGPQGPQGPEGSSPSLEDILSAIPLPQQSNTFSTGKDLTNPATPLIVASGQCLAIQPDTVSITGIIFQSGALLCQGDTPRYVIECYPGNPARCMPTVTDIKNGTNVSLNVGRSKLLDTIGNFNLYITSTDNETSPRRMTGGVASR